MRLADEKEAIISMVAQGRAPETHIYRETHLVGGCHRAAETQSTTFSPARSRDARAGSRRCVQPPQRHEGTEQQHLALRVLAMPDAEFVTLRRSDRHPGTRLAWSRQALDPGWFVSLWLRGHSWSSGTRGRSHKAQHPALHVPAMPAGEPRRPGLDALCLCSCPARRTSRTTLCASVATLESNVLCASASLWLALSEKTLCLGVSVAPSSQALITAAAISYDRRRAACS